MMMILLNLLNYLKDYVVILVAKTQYLMFLNQFYIHVVYDMLYIKVSMT